MAPLTKTGFRLLCVAIVLVLASSEPNRRANGRKAKVSVPAAAPQPVAPTSIPSSWVFSGPHANIGVGGGRAFTPHEARTAAAAAAAAAANATGSGKRVSAESSSCADGTAILAYQNHYRALHGAAPLTWDPAAAAAAATWAAGCSLSHSPYTAWGENLAWGFGPGSWQDGTCGWAAAAWYVPEEPLYQPGDDWSESYSHFTQMVWKSTTGVGCAWASCPSINAAWVVCEYSPPGNVIGQFAENVGMPAAGAGK